MKVLVCVKRVPAVAGQITLTDGDRAIDTRHLGFQIGPHEEGATEEAVRLIEANGGESVVLTLGPAESIEQLRDTMALGISRAIHLVTDGEEWDGQSAAAAIVDAVKADEAASGPFDIILMGNESADAGGYQVAVRVARALGRPAIGGIKGVTVTGSSVRCEQDAAGGRDVYELPLPAVISVFDGINLPRYPSVPGRIRAKSKPVAASQPARPAQQLNMVRLVVPQVAASEAEILGRGPEAAPAVVDLLASLGVL